jgi:endoglucanase
MSTPIVSRPKLISLLIAALCALCGLLAAPGARAEEKTGVVALDQAAYTVSEHAGYAHIIIRRTHPAAEGWVRYGVRRTSDSAPGVDFDTVPNTDVHFARGQSTYSFNVKIYDTGMNTSTAVHADVYLYGAYLVALGEPHQATITILRDDPLDPRNPTNPLGLPATPNGNVLYNAPFYVAGKDSAAGQAMSRTSDAVLRGRLAVIANAPSARRFYFWNEPDPRSLISAYLQWTQRVQPGSVVQLSTYTLVHGNCGYTSTDAFTRRYRRWMDRYADAIGNFRVVLYLDPDSLITAGCLNARQRHIRLVDQLAWAVDRLERQPHVAVYLDAGAADSGPWQTTAKWLAQAAVKHAQGFFVNSTHFDWTTKELFYAQRIANRLGGVHFVVDTHGGGRGPLATKHPRYEGNEQLCNPPGRGLGPLSTDTGYKWADAFIWGTAAIGNSGGKCRPGAPANAVFWPQYAAMLVANRVLTVTGPKCPLLRQPTGTAARVRRRSR